MFDFMDMSFDGMSSEAGVPSQWSLYSRCRRMYALRDVRQQLPNVSLVSD
jgi:hypothetical protein